MPAPKKYTTMEREAAKANRKSEDEIRKVAYLKFAKTDAYTDLMKKLRAFIDYHVRIAQDGVGSEIEEQMGPDGQVVKLHRTVRFTADMVVRELGKASGLQEIFDYVERQTSEK